MNFLYILLVVLSFYIKIFAIIPSIMPFLSYIFSSIIFAPVAPGNVWSNFSYSFSWSTTYPFIYPFSNQSFLLNLNSDIVLSSSFFHNFYAFSISSLIRYIFFVYTSPTYASSTLWYRYFFLQNNSKILNLILITPAKLNKMDTL